MLNVVPQRRNPDRKRRRPFNHQSSNEVDHESSIRCSVAHCSLFNRDETHIELVTIRRFRLLDFYNRFLSIYDFQSRPKVPLLGLVHVAFEEPVNGENHSDMESSTVDIENEYLSVDQEHEYMNKINVNSSLSGTSFRATVYQLLISLEVKSIDLVSGQR